MKKREEGTKGKRMGIPKGRRAISKRAGRQAGVGESYRRECEKKT